MYQDERPPAHSRWGALRSRHRGALLLLALVIVALLAADVFLLRRARRDAAETARLRGAMTEVERARTDAELARDENRLRVMVALGRHQARMDEHLHLAISLDSGMMYLEREGAVLRAMPVRFGGERTVGTPPDTVRMATPRGARSIAAVRGDTLVLDGGAIIYATSAGGTGADSASVIPGGIRARAADLAAIRQSITPGMTVYLY